MSRPKSKEMDLTVGNPFWSLLKFAIPVILGNLFQLFYTLADSVIVGKTLGADSLAAVGATSIIIYFVFCFINGFTGGFGICLGQRCGAKDEKGMRKSVAVSTLLSIIFTIVLTLICCLLAHQILRWMQIPEDISGEAYDYMFVVLLGTGATVFYNMISNMLRALGDSKTPLYFLVFSSVLNIFLDILFIVPFHMGVAGAALATGISQCIGGLLPLILFLGKNDSLLHLVPTRLEWRPFFLSCTNGMSELMGNISSSIVSMLYNFQLLNYAGENGIAAYGVLMYVQFIFIAVFFGYTIGVGPVIGYHYGAGNHAELKNLLRKSLKLNIITGISMTILANLFAGALSRIFVGYDPELYAMTKSAFHIFALSFLVCGINIFASAFFTALNNGLVSAVISFLRTLVFQVGSVLILPAFLGLTGIWLSNTFADLMAMLISIIFLAAMRKRYHYA